MSAYFAGPPTVSGAAEVSPLCTQVRCKTSWVEQVRAHRLRERLLGDLGDQFGEQLVNGRIEPKARRRRRSEFRRWQRGRPMALWQMDVVGGIHLADGVEVKCVTGIDDNSRFVVSSMLVATEHAPEGWTEPSCDLR